MKIDELKKYAENGNLTVKKRVFRQKVRRQFKYDKNYEIIGEKKIPYTVYSYEARTPDMDDYQCYRIRRADFKELEEIINGLNK